MGEHVAVNETESRKQDDAAKRRALEPKAQKRKPSPKPSSKAPKSEQRGVAVGSTAQATFLDDGAGDTVANGESGFSRRMLLETSSAAKLVDGFDELQLRSLEPDVERANRQVRHRIADAAHQKEKADDFFVNGSTEETYAQAASWCTAHATQIDTDVAHEQEMFTSFNAWVPSANGFYNSMTRLRAQQRMLGAHDVDTLVKQLLSGLGDVSKVAGRMQLAHDQGHAPTLNVPVVDDTLDQTSAETLQAGKAMNTAYLGFQQELLAQEKVDVHHEGDKATARLDEINKAKAFVRNAGTTIDLAMSVVDGAPANIATATNGIKRAEATFGSIANKRQIMNGERQTHNPTYVTTNASGETIVRNVQTGQDRGMEAKPGEAYAHQPTPESSFSLPSVSGVLGKIVDFAYSNEVAKINDQLEQIKAHCDIIQSVSDAAASRQRIQSFQDALNAFALKCNELQRRMEQRRQQYLEFGVQLDNFARTDVASQKAGLSPGNGHERYASIMTVVSTIREVVAIGRSSLHGFDSTDKLKERINEIRDHRERTDDGRSDIPFLMMPAEELNRMTDMYIQVDGFETRVAREISRLGPVDNAAAQILGPLSQGTDGSSRGGLY